MEGWLIVAVLIVIAVLGLLYVVHGLPGRRPVGGGGDNSADPYVAGGFHNDSGSGSDGGAGGGD